MHHVHHGDICARPFHLLNSALEDCSHTDGESTAPPECAQMPFDSVVIGHAPSAFVYDNLNTAFRVLMGEDVERIMNMILDPKTTTRTSINLLKPVLFVVLAITLAVELGWFKPVEIQWNFS